MNRDMATRLFAGTTLVIAALLGSLTPARPAAAQNPGLVAAYGFAEGAGTTVVDSSGNNNTGIINGATWTTAGQFGSALVFNGTNATVTIPNAASLGLTTHMTLEAWIYPTAALAGWRAVIAKNTDRYYLMASSDGGNLPVAGGTWTAGGNQNLYGPSVLPVNTWTHLAATYDGTLVRLYVNGVQVASQAQTSSLTTSTGTLQIGGDAYSGENFAGRIDEVRIYDRALTATEIQTDMVTPVGGTPPPPDTTPPAVAISAPTAGSPVFNLVTIAANASDNTGIAGVRFFVDGTQIGSEVTAAPYSVIWDAGAASQGSHTLTATARDFNNNSTTSLPVSVTVVATTPALVGQWGSVFSWPIVAVNTSLLPNGNVLTYDGQTVGYDARLWNPTTGTFLSVPNPTTNMFCSGQCQLADGRILVAGGHFSGHVGLRDTNIFNSTTSAWSLVAPMKTQRWYPTVTTLGDGRVLVTAGEINCSGCSAPLPEIYNPQTNVWTELGSASLSMPYYPHMYLLPDGRVLAAGTSEHPIVTQVLTIGTQTWSIVDPDPFDGGSSAMYLPGKVIKSGTSADPDLPVFPSATTTYVIDMTQPTPRWQQTPPMGYPRTYHTLTILPDGDVLATGGGTTTNAIGVSTAVLPAEIWSPVTQTWTIVASMGAPRLYHSEALLMPDARVLVLGGGHFNGINEPTDQLSAQYYSPPYLFNGPRPTITSAPATITYGGSFTVQTPQAAGIAAVTFIRLGSVTHTINMDQRLVPLAFTAGGGSLTVQAPANGNLAPPGYYMLFILDANGVPSVAAIMKIS